MALTGGDSGGSPSFRQILGGAYNTKPKTTTYNNLVNSPVPSSGTPLRAPAPYVPPAPKPAPYYAPAPAQQSFQQAPVQSPSFGIGTPTGGGIDGGGGSAAQSKPVMSESDWLSGDNDYQDMSRELDTNLADFLKRISTQETQFDDDYKLSEQGFGRNRDQGMLAVGEDFTSRGLANSGLFNNAKDETFSNFQRQENGMKTAKDRTKADFQTQRDDKTNATRIGKDNAKSDSLKRMSMSQGF